VRIGLLGGTFDPPHIGHLIMGESAADALDLAQILYIPAADPPHKQDRDKTPVEHRLAMLSLAVADNPRFAISRIDIERPGPHYTVDTVRILQAQHPEEDFFFVMGSDSLRDLVKWHQPEKLMELCPLVVVPRPGVDASPEMHEDRLPGLAARVIMVESPMVDIASTDIVARSRAGYSIRYTIPESVFRYVEKQGLYKGNS
jgi:nicotinate-nucleotide adenylyltransferase